MNERIDFGIVGGYGATGPAVVSELSRCGKGRILIGGRDLAKGKALAAEYDSQASAARLDVLDALLPPMFDCRQLCRAGENLAGPGRPSGFSAALPLHRSGRHDVCSGTDA